MSQCPRARPYSIPGQECRIGRLENSVPPCGRVQRGGRLHLHDVRAVGTAVRPKAQLTGDLVLRRHARVRHHCARARGGSDDRGAPPAAVLFLHGEAPAMRPGPQRADLATGRLVRNRWRRSWPERDRNAAFPVREDDGMRASPASSAGDRARSGRAVDVEHEAVGLPPGQERGSRGALPVGTCGHQKPAARTRRSFDRRTRVVRDEEEPSACSVRLADGVAG